MIDEDNEVVTVTQREFVDVSPEEEERDEKKGDSSAPEPPPIDTSSAPGAVPEKKSGVPSLVLGILSLLIPYIGLVLGILAIIMGNNAKASNPTDSSEYKLANAGWILGIIGTCLQGVVIGVAIISALFVVNLIGYGLSWIPFRFFHH